MNRSDHLRRARAIAPGWLQHAAAVPVCAWCSRELGRVDPPGTSHGICPRHKAAELAAFRASQHSSPAHGAPGEPATMRGSSSANLKQSPGRM